MKCETQNQHHEACSRGEGDRQGCIGTPHRIQFLLNDDDLTWQRLDSALNRQRAVSVRKNDIGDGALLAGHRQQLRRADGVKEPVAITIADRCHRYTREDSAVAATDDQMTACSYTP